MTTLTVASVRFELRTDSTGDGSLRNSAFLVHRDGRLETQDELHLTPPEHALWAVGGDDLLIIGIGPFTSAVQVRADIEFPEIPRYLVDRGVDLIRTPSLTWNRRGAANRIRYGAHARAMENQLFVVTAPLVGSSGLPEAAPLHCTGSALVAGPIDRTMGANDGVVRQGSGSKQGLVTATLDLSPADRVVCETRGSWARSVTGRSLRSAGIGDRFHAVIAQLRCCVACSLSVATFRPLRTVWIRLVIAPS